MRYHPLHVLVVAFAVAVPVRSASAQDLLAQAKEFERAGRLDSAYATILRAAEAEPNRAEVQFNLGQIAGERAQQVGGLGAYGIARKCKQGYGRAVQLEPDNPLYLQGLIGFLSQAPGIVGGDRDSALVLATRLRRIDELSGTIQMANVLQRGGSRDKQRADSLMAAFALLHATDRSALSAVASYYATSQRPELALQIQERLLARNPGDVVARFGVGRNLVVLQREPRRAIEMLKAVIAAPVPVAAAGQPGYFLGAPQWRLGQAYLQLGIPDSARLYFEQALRVNPQFQQAQRSLDSLSRH